MICNKIRVCDPYLDYALEFYYKAPFQSVEWKLLRCVAGLKGTLVSGVEISIHLLNAPFTPVPF